MTVPDPETTKKALLADIDMWKARSRRAEQQSKQLLQHLGVLYLETLELNRSEMEPDPETGDEP